MGVYRLAPPGCSGGDGGTNEELDTADRTIGDRSPCMMTAARRPGEDPAEPRPLGPGSRPGLGILRRDVRRQVARRPARLRAGDRRRERLRRRLPAGGAPVPGPAPRGRRRGRRRLGRPGPPPRAGRRRPSCERFCARNDGDCRSASRPGARPFRRGWPNRARGRRPGPRRRRPPGPQGSSTTDSASLSWQSLDGPVAGRPITRQGRIIQHGQIFGQYRDDRRRARMADHRWYRLFRISYLHVFSESVRLFGLEGPFDGSHGRRSAGVSLPREVSAPILRGTIGMTRTRTRPPKTRPMAVLGVLVTLTWGRGRADGQAEVRNITQPIPVVDSGGPSRAGPGRCCSPGPTGRSCLSAGMDKVVHVWDLRGPRPALARTIRPRIWRGPAGVLYAMALSPAADADGQRLLAVAGYGVDNNQGEIKLYRFPGSPNRPTGDLVAQLPQRRRRAAAEHGHIRTVACLAFDPIGPIPRLGERRRDRPRLGPRQSGQPGHGRHPPRARRRGQCGGVYPRRPAAPDRRLPTAWSSSGTSTAAPRSPGPCPTRRGTATTATARRSIPRCWQSRPTAAWPSSAARTATSSATTPPTSPARPTAGQGQGFGSAQAVEPQGDGRGAGEAARPLARQAHDVEPARPGIPGQDRLRRPGLDRRGGARPVPQRRPARAVLQRAADLSGGARPAGARVRRGRADRRDDGDPARRADADGWPDAARDRAGTATRDAPGACANVRRRLAPRKRARQVCPAARRAAGLGGLPRSMARRERLARLHDQIGDAVRRGRPACLSRQLSRARRRVAGTIDELLDFRRRVLARPHGFACDVAYLRGAQEEMWQKLLQLQFAPNPSEVLSWMVRAGIEATVRAYGGDLRQGFAASRDGPRTITRWTSGLRSAMNATPGHSTLFAALRHAAFTEDSGLLFVHAGVDPRARSPRRATPSGGARRDILELDGAVRRVPPRDPRLRPGAARRRRERVRASRSTAAPAAAAGSWPPASPPTARSSTSPRRDASGSAWPSDRGVAAIDQQVAAGDEARRVAGEEDRGAGDLVGAAEAAEQMLRAERLHAPTSNEP